MFRNLIPALSHKYHLIAPNYPGYGNSSMPNIDDFDYTFDRLAKVMEKFVRALNLQQYSLYLMDYGAPIGFRLAVAHPERVQALLIQNGNAYEESLKDFWTPIKTYWQDKTTENADKLREFLNVEAIKWQYIHGVRDSEAISPDSWNLDRLFLDRLENQEIQLALFYSYSSNPPLYPQWQEYLRKHQPPTLITWGKNDYIFPESGAHPYKQDLKNIEFHLLDTGHFALEEEGEAIANHIDNFLSSQLPI
ncbi:alpha/beta fold hydrolase, partial [Myxosarcina sp. GI1]|uniref:alpha/beta fold hydrolase n=1 Tax=Myxosarcina sp. GI1 TaxID=1541065 RepID=UPI0005689365